MATTVRASNRAASGASTRTARPVPRRPPRRKPAAGRPPRRRGTRGGPPDGGGRVAPSPPAGGGAPAPPSPGDAPGLPGPRDIARRGPRHEHRARNRRHVAADEALDGEAPGGGG